MGEMFTGGTAVGCEQTALVRRPSRRLAEGLVTYIERRPVDVDLARRQHGGYVAALHASGWTIREVPPADDLPDSVFVEDTVVIFDELAVVTRSGAVERRPEVDAVEPVVRDLGLTVAHIEAPGTLDGGDGGDNVLIAASAPKAAAQLDDLGFSPVVVDISEYEKLEGCATCLSVLIPPPAPSALSA
jgi:dimethylargininase